MQINKQEKSPIKQRILQYIENKGISKYQFYKETGITRGILDQNNGLSEDALFKFINYARDISLSWLLNGDGMMISKPNDNLRVESISSTMERKIDSQQIPLYDIEAAAGLVMINNEHSTPVDFISIPNLAPCDGAIQVRGESMMPRLQSGDIVVFKMVTNVQYIMWNEMYIISFEIDGDYYTLIKLIKKSKQSNHIQLVSINTEHEPIEIPIDAIRQLAQVKASIHYNSM